MTETFNFLKKNSNYIALYEKTVFNVTCHTFHLALIATGISTYPYPVSSSTIRSTLSSLYARVLSIKSAYKI